MAKFWTCPYGANHDFGEECDCQKMEKNLDRKKEEETLAQNKLPEYRQENEISGGMI